MLTFFSLSALEPTSEVMSYSSLQSFLANGKLNGNILTVTVVKKISSERYIVGDKSGLAVLEHQQNGKELKTGTGIKLIKPVRATENVLKCNTNFPPVKALEHDKVSPTSAQLQEIESKVENTENNNVKEDKYLTFEEIKKMTAGTVVQKVTFLVTRVSRIIKTTNGHYQICGIKDIEGQTLSINLYDKFTNSLEVGNVIDATKIKKFNLKKEGEYFPRLSTTRFTLISNAPQKEKAAFENIKIADNSLDGTIIGFSEISCYYSCTKHWNKIDDDGACPVCTSKPDESKFDFKAKLLVASADNEEEIKTFLIFKRAATMITTEETEDDIENKLAEYCGRQCTVEYDDTEEDDKLVILKRLIVSI